MMRNHPARRLAAGVLAAATALALGACSSNPIEAVTSIFSAPTVEEARSQAASAATPQASSPTILSDGTLTVGLPSSSSAPLTITAQDGSFEGYNVDVAYALGDALGLEVEFVSVTSASSACGTECDIVMGIEAAGAGSLTVVGSYAEDAIAFFHKGAEEVSQRSAIDGTTVGVQEGSVSQQRLKRSDLDVSQQSYANLNEAFAALEEGAVDYVLCPALSGAYLQGEYQDIAMAGTIDVRGTVGVGVAASNTELQALVKDAIDKVSTNGVCDILRSKWLGGMGVLSADSQVTGITISAGGVESATSDADSLSSGAQDGSTAGANAADITG